MRRYTAHMRDSSVLVRQINWEDLLQNELFLRRV